MWQPMTKARWARDRDIYRRAWPTGYRRLGERYVLTCNVDWLLEHLYGPDAEVGATAPWARFGELMRNEPINWGDLSADAVKKGHVWTITLEEASPGGCPALCAYVTGWLNRWGWNNVEVVTEW